MSEVSWLFVFALCGAPGGIAAFASGQKAIGCQVQVDTRQIASWGDKYYVVLVCGVTDPIINQLQVTRIAISQPLTISGGGDRRRVP